MTPEQVRAELIPSLQGIWPKLNPTEDQIAIIAGVFRYATPSAAYNAAIAWAVENPDSWPQWKGIAAKLEDTGPRADPSPWLPSDEISLGHLMEMYRRLHGKGMVGDEYLDELHVARVCIGKCPTQQEREDAWAVLNRDVEETNARLQNNGSRLRCTKWPGARYYLLPAEGGEEGANRERWRALRERIGGRTRRDAAKVGGALRTAGAWM